MKRFLHPLISLLCLGTIAFLLVVGCSQMSQQTAISPTLSTEPCRVVQHTMGQTCIPLNPQRIVALDILSLGDMVALGIKPIAAEIWSPRAGNIQIPSYLADKLQGITLYNTSASQPNLEKILQLKPDLIISPSDLSLQGIYKQLSHIAPTVLVPWPEISRDWKQHLRETARIFDKAEVANQLLTEYYHRVDVIRQTLKTSKSHPKKNHNSSFFASFVFATDGLNLAQKDSFAGTILNDIGLLSSKLVNSLALPISEETFSEIDSDVLFVGAYQENGSSILERFRRRPLWSKIKAVQHNQVYLVDFQAWYGFDFLAAHTVLDDIEQHLVHPTQRSSGKSAVDPNTPLLSEVPG